MSVAVVIQHAIGMRRIVLPSVTSLALPYFSTSFHKHYDFRGDVLSFFFNNFAEIFLIIGRPERDIVIHEHRSLCKVPVILVRF